MSEFDPIIYERMIAKRNKEKALAEQAKRFEAENAFEVKRAIVDKQAVNRAKFENHFGLYGADILGEGDGGGFTAVPHAMDIYQDTLGLSIKEAWYLKIIMRYLPDIRPSMSKIARRTGQSESALSAIKKGLVKKGYVRDFGAVDIGSGQMQKRLNIMPFFDAIFLCAACDPNSKLVRSQAMDKIRTIFSNWIDGLPMAGLFERRGRYMSIDLPLSIETAKCFAEAKGFTLNWKLLEEMQGVAEMKDLESQKADKLRELQLKHAIKDGICGAFEFRVYPNVYRNWLLPLCQTGITGEELRHLSRAYISKGLEAGEVPNVKGYMKYISDTLELPENKKVLAERDVYEMERRRLMEVKDLEECHAIEKAEAAKRQLVEVE